MLILDDKINNHNFHVCLYDEEFRPHPEQLLTPNPKYGEATLSKFTEPPLHSLMGKVHGQLNKDPHRL